MFPGGSEPQRSREAFENLRTFLLDRLKAPLRERVAHASTLAELETVLEVADAEGRRIQMKVLARYKGVSDVSHRSS
jgi:hypothetical protein